MRTILTALALLVAACSDAPGPDELDASPPIDAPAASPDGCGPDAPELADAMSCLGPTQVCHDAGTDADAGR